MRYENEHGTVVVGSMQPKITKISPAGKKVVNTLKIKRSVVFLSFRTPDIAIRATVSKYGEANFVLTHYLPDFPEPLGISFGSAGPETTSDFSFLGFDFKMS